MTDTKNGKHTFDNGAELARILKAEETKRMTAESAERFARLNALIVDARKSEFPELSLDDTLEQTLEKLALAMHREQDAKPEWAADQILRNEG